MARSTEPVAQPLPTGREDKIRLIMRTFNLTRKPALRLLRDNGNDVNRTLKCRHNGMAVAESSTNVTSAAATAEPHGKPKPQSVPIDTPDASRIVAPPQSPTRAAPPTHDTELSSLMSQLSIISPLLSALQRKLAAMPKGRAPDPKPDPKASKKISFYAYSIAHLPRSLSVLPPRPHKPPRISTDKIDPLVDAPERFQHIYEAGKNYPYKIIQIFFPRKNAVHVMGCNSKEDAELCLEGYRQSFDGRPVFVHDGKRQRCGTTDLGDKWGFEVRIADRRVCTVDVLKNEDMKVDEEVEEEQGRKKA